MPTTVDVTPAMRIRLTLCGSRRGSGMATVTVMVVGVFTATVGGVTDTRPMVGAAYNQVAPSPRKTTIPTLKRRGFMVIKD
jgi:hypothetical protein